MLCIKSHLLNFTDNLAVINIYLSLTSITLEPSFNKNVFNIGHNEIEVLLYVETQVPKQQI